MNDLSRSPGATTTALGALVVGEALVDVVRTAAGAVTEHVGGSPANVAMGLARLDHPVQLVAHLAHDDRGERIAGAVQKSGAGLLASWGAQRTSTAEATLDDAGAATYEFDLEWRYDAAAVEAGLSDLSGAQRIGHVHTGSLAATLEPGGTAVLEHLRTLRERHTISYDPNARPSIMGDATTARARVEEVAALADVVKCSDEDLEWFYDDRAWPQAAEHLLELGPRLVVTTRGGGGAVCRWRDAQGEPQVAELQAPSVTVADTVGAGDSFMAGLVSGLLDAGLLGHDSQGAPAREAAGWHDLEALRPALERGLATGAWTVQREGAGGPSRAELG